MSLYKLQLLSALANPPNHGGVIVKELCGLGQGRPAVSRASVICTVVMITPTPCAVGRIEQKNRCRSV